MNRLKLAASKAGEIAVWLWRLPPVRSKLGTIIFRVVGGGALGSIAVAVMDALAQ